MDKNELIGNWEMVKGKVKEKWAKLTDDDLQQIAGKKDQLVGKIEKLYGITKEEASKQIDELQKLFKS